jgi:hypothetical protein
VRDAGTGCRWYSTYMSLSSSMCSVILGPCFSVKHSCIEAVLQTQCLWQFGVCPVDHARVCKRHITLEGGIPPKVYLQGACHMTLGHVAGLHKWVHETTNSWEVLPFVHYNGRVITCSESRLLFDVPPSQRLHSWRFLV